MSNLNSSLVPIGLGLARSMAGMGVMAAGAVPAAVGSSRDFPADAPERE